MTLPGGYHQWLWRIQPLCLSTEYKVVSPNNTRWPFGQIYKVIQRLAAHFVFVFVWRCFIITLQMEENVVKAEIFHRKTVDVILQNRNYMTL